MKLVDYIPPTGRIAKVVGKGPYCVTLHADGRHVATTILPDDAKKIGLDSDEYDYSARVGEIATITSKG